MRRLKKSIWPVKVTVNRPESILEIETWLGDTLGNFEDRWYAVYTYKYTDFYFKNPQDAAMFALRWS